MRIGYFGGSFDPPHLGHLAVAQAAGAAFELDRVLLAPTGKQPLKPDGPTASFADRLSMVSLLCGVEGSPDQCDLEASALDAPREDATPNYTIDALRKLREEVGTGPPVFLIVGMDAFLNVRQWRSCDLLFEFAEWIVVSRPGFNMGEFNTLGLRPEQLGRVHLLEHLNEQASATKIRALIRAGSGCEELLPRSIFGYIHAHHLYGT